ncbi:MAG: polysaccharide biosynthesis tyrosine autokinase [Planctomycetes bacterium]|nr:polysaccharide biosynthesis tyrosine autokinase [Planctomycetota bacterium]
MAHSLRAGLRFASVVRRHKWVIIVALFVAGLLAIFQFRTATPYFQADASLLVQQTGVDVPGRFEGPSQSVLATYRQLFVSDAVLSGALAKLDQFPPEVNRNAPRQLWPRMLRRGLKTAANGNTSIVEISYQSQDPQVCVSVINAVVASSLEFMDKNQKGLALELVNNLDQERRNLEKRLLVKERDLLEAKRLCGDIGIADGAKAIHPLVQRAMKMNDRLLQSQERRAKLKVSLAALRKAVAERRDLTQNLRNLEPLIGKELIERALGLGFETPEQLTILERELIDEQVKLRAIQQHYDIAHPKVIEAVERIRTKQQYLASARHQMRSGITDPQVGERMVKLTEEAFENASHYEAIDQQQYAKAEHDAIALNDRLANVAIADREMTMLRNLHESILNRIANIDINQDQHRVSVVVVSEPLVPAGPVWPNLRTLLFRFLLGGLFAGLLAVFVSDLLDDRFRSPDELKDQLGLNVLAMVRHLTTAHDEGAESIQVHAAPQSAESEAFRTLRTGLAFSGQELSRLAVTSPEPGDGKTTILVNLAAAFAQAGKRTLLIDADLRKPGLTRLFEMRSMQGLPDMLRGDDPIQDACARCVQTTDIERLDVLPCGPRPSDPSELLSSPRMEEVIAWAESNYDQVLVDCPPILAASDAAIVGRLTDGMLLVISPAKNRRRLAIRAVDALAATDVNIVGVVLNNLGDEKDGGYSGYGYGYGYGYGDRSGYGYGQDEDDDDSAANSSEQESETTANIVRRAA